MSPTISRIQEIASQEIRIGSERLSYLSGFDCTAGLARALATELGGYSSVFMIVDHHARRHAAEFASVFGESAGLTVAHVTPGEQRKRLTLVEDLLEQAVANAVGRGSVVVAMGGGLVGNIGGMVASLLYRGLPLVHLPTTPVAAFDSVLSAKQAVNLQQGKNLCGTFLTPALIACDLAWLTTVPEAQMAVGLAEMAKNVLAVSPADADRFTDALASRRSTPERTLRTLLDIGIGAKAGYLAIDPHERNEALVFEYGHTVGHAIEFASHGAIQHGEAVAWGMLVAAELATELYGLPEADRQTHLRLFAALGIDRAKLAEVDAGLVKRLLRTDNKRGYLGADTESLAMVLLKSLGNPANLGSRPLVPVPLRAVEEKIDAVFPHRGRQ